MTPVKSRAVRGFSLIEVLIAVVIMSIGLLALASLQLSLVRSSGHTKAQSVAMGLAKEQIENLRAFTDYAGYRDVDAAGPVTVTVGGIGFEVTTSVTRYVYDADDITPVFVTYDNNAELATLQADTAIEYVSGRDFKQVSVMVTWDDATGTTTTGVNTVTLDDVVDWLDPADTASLAKKSASATPRTAEIIITDPSSEAGVIPIAIGDDTDTAATNPRPEVNSSGTETRFDILTYSALSGGTALAQSRVETNVIRCTCDTAEKPTATDARGYRPTYFNGVRYVAPTLTTYVPPAGQDASTAGNESPFCDECCRDHNDPASVITAKKPRFDPWRSAHDHYYRDVDGVLQKTDNTNTGYDEACRLIRVDGIFRVAADFNNEYFNLLETKNDGSTTEYVPSGTATDNYVAMVLDYLDQKVITPADTSTDPTASAYNNEVSETDIATLESTHSINDPVSLELQRSADSYKWLHTRGLYIDYLEAEALEAISTAKSDCEDLGCSAAEKEVAVLRVLPFTSINVTELSEWTPLVNQSNADYISVTNDGFSTQSGDEPVRGKAVPQLDHLPAGDALAAVATASLRKSNSGLALKNTNAKAIDEDEDGVDGNGAPVTTEDDEDTQAFTIPAGGVVDNSGAFSVTIPTYDGSKIPSFSGTNVTNCTFAEGQGNNPGSYGCSVSETGTAVVLNVTSYNYKSSTETKGTGRALTCTLADGTSPVTYITTNANNPKLFTCYNYTVTGASSSGSGVATLGSVVDDTLLGESTSVNFSLVNDGDVLTLDFAAGTTSYGYTCTYSGSTYTIQSANCP